MPGGSLWPRRVLTVLRRAAANYLAHDGIFLASGLAFDLLLCMVPLTLVIVSILGYTVPSAENALSRLSGVLETLAPESQKVVMDNVGTIIAHRGQLGILGLVLFFAFGSLVFGSARLVVNTVFHVERRRGYLRGKGVDFLVMLGAGLLLVLAIATSWLLSLLRELSDRVEAMRIMVQPGWQLLGDASGFLFTLALFFLLYRFSPAGTISSRALALASVTAACLFHLSKWGFGLYVEIAQDYAPVYGALGGLLFFFLWLYYACTVFILGAEVGSAYDRTRSEAES